MSTLHVTDSLKALRETLCSAQWAVNQQRDPRKLQHSERLERLIADIDRQRPLGPDGKHDERHTATCGCSDHHPKKRWRLRWPLYRSEK